MEIKLKPRQAQEASQEENARLAEVKRRRLLIEANRKNKKKR